MEIKYSLIPISLRRCSKLHLIWALPCLTSLTDLNGFGSKRYARESVCQCLVHLWFEQCLHEESNTKLNYSLDVYNNWIAQNKSVNIRLARNCFCLCNRNTNLEYKQLSIFDRQMCTIKLLLLFQTREKF